MTRIFAYIHHKQGILDDSAAELAAAARRIDPDAKPIAVITGDGPELDGLCFSLRSTYGEIWKITGSSLAYPNADVVRKALIGVLPAGSILLISHNSFGMDLAPGLSIKLVSPYASDIVEIEGMTGTSLDMVRQEYDGQVNVHIQCETSAGAILTIRPGAFQPETLPAGEESVIIDKTSEIGKLDLGRRYLGMIVPEVGDVDITKADMIVSVGRGIQDGANIAIAEQLASAIGGVVACSRPVSEAKWMDKSRSVGISGQTVKPKFYIACGISGAFQHMGGIKGNPFIAAINKNPKAPIFQVANVGIVADVLEFLPELTLRIRKLHN